MNLKELCRICLGTGNVISLFNTNCLNHIPISCAEVMTQITAVIAKEDDGFPSHICKKCLNKLRAAFKFRMLCEESYTKLKIQIHSKKITDTIDNLKKIDTIFQTDENEVKIQNVTCSENRLSPAIKNEDIIEPNDFDENDRLEYQINNINDEIKIENTDNVQNPGLGVQGVKKFAKKIYQCSYCGKSFNSKYYLRKHEEAHSAVKPYFCEICKKNFRSPTHKLVHLMRLTCDVCPKVFQRPASLRAHQAMHAGLLPLHCPHVGCNRAFAINSRLQHHLKVHTNERNFICQYCSHAARDKQQLNVHIRYFHTKEKNYLCGTCGKAFVSPQARYYHAKRHENVRNHHCSHCDKSFVFAFGLREHLVTHTGEKRFPCSLCSARFSRKAHKDKHEAAVHGLKLQSTKRTPIIPPATLVLPQET